MRTFAIHDCELCSRLCGARKQIVNGQGKESAVVALVGQNPDEDADEAGVPLAGKVGKLLRLLCEAARLPVSWCYRVEAVRCHSPGNAKPNKMEIDNCRPYLLEDLRNLQPRVIVTLGEVALQALYTVQASGVYEQELAEWELECHERLRPWTEAVREWEELGKGDARKALFPDGKPRKPKLPPKPKKPKAQHTAVRDVAGHTLWQPDLNIRIVPTWHPRFLLAKHWEYCELVISHLEKARRIAEGAQ